MKRPLGLTLTLTPLTDFILAEAAEAAEARREKKRKVMLIGSTYLS